MKTLAVLGGTGALGRSVWPALAQSHRVTLLARGGAEQIARHLVAHQQRPRVVTGDATDANALAAVLDGADTLYCALTPHRLDPDFYAKHTALVGGVLEAAAAAGTRRVVLVGGSGVMSLPSGADVRHGWLSSVGAKMGAKMDQYNRAHGENWAALAAAGFGDHTMLCPGFMVDAPGDMAAAPPLELMDTNDRAFGGAAGLAASFDEVAHVSARVLCEAGEAGRWRGRRVGVVSTTDYWPRFARCDTVSVIDPITMRVCSTI
jgi:uncharacterized protein YbjT (DUF2867 family)